MTGTLKPAKAIATFDSATAMLRATSRALQGRDFAALGQGRLEALPVRLSVLLPVETRRRAFALTGGLEGVRPGRLRDLDMAEVAAWVVEHYGRGAQDGGGAYPGLVIGSSNGAAVHLCALTGMPWLPQTLLVPVWWPNNDPGRPDAARDYAARIAEPLLASNPDVVLHHMHDGNQDRLMIDWMMYFRLKWRRLPAAYAAFIDTALAPGAPIVILEDRTQWPVDRVAERHVFQTGGLGGLAPEGYRGPHTPTADSLAPEAEWGFEPGLDTEVEAWAAQRGHPVVRLRIDAPQALSAPVADLIRAHLRSHGAPADRLLIESFVMLDPVQAMRSGSVPYWAFFGVRPALESAYGYVEQARLDGDPFASADVLIFPHGIASQGATQPYAWAALADQLSSGRVRLLKGTLERWPAHFDTLARYNAALRALPAAPDRVRGRCDVEAAIADVRSSLHASSPAGRV